MAGLLRVPWNVAEWRQVRHHDVLRAGIGQPADQRSHPGGGCGYVRRAVIIAQIVGSSKDDVKRGWVNEVGGEIIVHLFAHVIDGDGDVAERSRDGDFLVGAVVRGRPAEGIIRPATEAVSCGG